MESKTQDSNTLEVINILLNSEQLFRQMMVSLINIRFMNAIQYVKQYRLAIYPAQVVSINMSILYLTLTGMMRCVSSDSLLCVLDMEL